jgi:hypothetical protein
MTTHFSHKNAVAETMKGVWEHALSMPPLDVMEDSGHERKTLSA